MNKELKTILKQAQNWSKKNKNIIIDFCGLGIMLYFVLRIIPTLVNLTAALSTLVIRNIEKGASQEFKLIFLFGVFYLLFIIIRFVFTFVNKMLETIKMTPPKQKKKVK